MKMKSKLAVLLSVVLAVVVLVSVPIVPVRAEVIGGQVPISPELQHIVSVGNYSLNFELSGFNAVVGDLNVTARSFVVTAFTNTVANVTTGYVVLDLKDVHAEYFYDGERRFLLDVGSASLNADLYIEGGYMDYTFYADSTSSVIEIIGNAVNNFT